MPAPARCSFYNISFMSTPNLQKLADTGTVFDRAYCQQTVCAPSRMSFTTGRRPVSPAPGSTPARLVPIPIDTGCQ